MLKLGWEAMMLKLSNLSNFTFQNVFDSKAPNSHNTCPQAECLKAYWLVIFKVGMMG